MSSVGLTPAELKHLRADGIRGARTFQTEGISEQTPRDYLDTREGRMYREALIRASPTASIPEIDQRALDQRTSGRELPRMQVIDEPLVKIVPRGAVDNSLAYCPFFARQSAFEHAVAHGRILSDDFPFRSGTERWQWAQVHCPLQDTLDLLTLALPSTKRARDCCPALIQSRGR